MRCSSKYVGCSSKQIRGRLHACHNNKNAGERRDERQLVQARGCNLLQPRITHLSAGTAAAAAGMIPTPDADEYLPPHDERTRAHMGRVLYMLPLSSISAAASPPSLSGVDRCSSYPTRRFSRAAWLTCKTFASRDTRAHNPRARATCAICTDSATPGPPNEEEGRV